MHSNPSFKAGGDIRPARFVTLAGDFTVTEVDTADTQFIMGVMHDGVSGAPGTPFDDTFAANDGDKRLEIFGPGEQCSLAVGASNVSGGNFLKSDNQGRAVNLDDTDAAVQYYGAIALHDAPSGGRVRVYVHTGVFAGA